VARSRDRAYEGEADTIYLGCWPRAVFERFGGFDEQLVRNQDDEHNLRLRRQGARLWQARASIRSISRAPVSGSCSASSLQYGYWRPFVFAKHGQPGSLRQLVPALFVAALAGAALAAPWWPGPLVLLLASYALYLAGAALAAARQAGDGCLLAHLPAVIATYHLGYGVGTWRGMLDVLLRRRTKEQWSRLTR
jgi:GT2 family glycosyltransferase